jgi:hypothetical protein
MAQLLTTLTNKEKVELVGKILDEAGFRTNPIYCCTNCSKIDVEDEAFFCDLCPKAVCEACVSKKFKEESLCETCIEKLCCGCSVKMCRFKCRGNEKGCGKVFCDDCRKSGLNRVGKHVCEKC